MLFKYFVVCLVFTLVKNAVGDISLDYYFGIEDALRTAKYIENCNSDGFQESCQERCGLNHACLLGKCFCVAVKPQIKKEDLIRQLKKVAVASSPRHSDFNEDFDDDSATKDFSNFKSSTLKSVIEELLRRSKSEKEVQRATKEDSTSQSESEETANNYIKLDELAPRLTLRHHIAHFCPTLDIARQCIRKCMAKRKPAFCGKDHVCYCGHKYGSPKDESNDDSSPEGEYTPFADLYEKYFGPKHKPHISQKLEKPYKRPSSTTTDKATILIYKSQTKKVINTTESTVDESTTEEHTVDETTTDASTKDETTTEDSHTDVTTNIGSTKDETTTIESQNDETTSGESPTDETTTGGPSTEETTTEVSTK